MLVKFYLKKYFFNRLIFFHFFNNSNLFFNFDSFFYHIFLKNKRILFDNSFAFSNYFFYTKNSTFYFYYLTAFFNYFFFINFFMRVFFSRFIFFVSVGLGFKRKRKFKKNKKYLELYIGNRHRILCKLEDSTYVYLLKRSTIYMFANLKKKIYLVLNRFRSAKKELAFKIKGFFFFRFKMNKALSRAWAFARRVRFKKIKTKLSKKQKLL